jgi:hypothetical protein
MNKQLLFVTIFLSNVGMFAGNGPSTDSGSSDRDTISQDDYYNSQQAWDDLRSPEDRMRNDTAYAERYYEVVAERELQRQENEREFQAEREASREEAHRETLEAHKDDNKEDK